MIENQCIYSVSFSSYIIWQEVSYIIYFPRVLDVEQQHVYDGMTMVMSIIGKLMLNQGRWVPRTAWCHIRKLKN